MSSPSIHVLDSVLDFPSAEDGNGQSAGSEFSRSLFKNLVASTKSSQVLPVGDDFKYMETFPEFKDSSKRISEKSLGLILKLAGWIQPDPVPSAENLLDDVERYEVALDSIDISLERVDSYLYKLKNGGKESQPSPAPNLIDVVTPYAKKKRKESRPQVINALFKPQLKFKRAVDNSWIPFVPAIIDKPNAKHPLPDYRAVESELKDNRMQWVPWIRQDIAKDPYIPHPYQSEVETFVVPNRQLGIASEKLFRPLKEVECRWIDDEDQLSELSTILESQLEFAIDLEAHSLRSYQGITCLMQISTRDQDFLIDTLELRDQLHVLNSSFTNPDIVKVLHGGDYDVLWLQRDFGLYLVNVFDTGKASRILEFPQFNLAYLLQHFCDVVTDKRYQLADWRIRPLPADMMLYARIDTHYLLYIYDRMRNQLVETSFKLNKSGNEVDLLRNLYQETSLLCLQKYEKPRLILSLDCARFCKMKGLQLSESQKRVLQGIFLWRDTIARCLDESPAFIMRDDVLIRLCQKSPEDSDSILHLANPVSDAVRDHVASLAEIISSAKSGEINLEVVFRSIPNKWFPDDYFDPTAELPKIASVDQSNSLQQTSSSFVDIFDQAGWVKQPDLSSNSQHESMLDFDQPNEMIAYKKIAHASNQNIDFLVPQSEIMGSVSEEYDNDNQLSNDSVINRDLVLKILSSFDDVSGLQSSRLNPSDLRKENILLEQEESSKPEVGTAEIIRQSGVVDISPTKSDEDQLIDAVSSDAPDDNDVPMSMNEIFRLSNRNKKFNKEKKKANQSLSTLESSSSNVREASTTDITSNMDSESFMKHIGWEKEEIDEKDSSIEISKEPIFSLKETKLPKRIPTGASSFDFAAAASKFKSETSESLSTPVFSPYSYQPKKTKSSHNKKRR